MTTALNAILAECRIKIDGSDISTQLYKDMLMAEVHQSLHLPSMFVLKFFDPNFIISNGTTFSVGKQVEVLMGQTEANTKSLLTGEIVSLELEFEENSLPVWTVRGYDKLHRLHRGRRTRSFI